MATLLLARHGETQWNRDHKWQGHTGPPLNEHGLRQAEALAAQVDGLRIDAIYSSDTVRARQTAEIVATQIGITVRTDPRLREVNFGAWEGLTRQQINDRYAGAFARWESLEQAEPTGGESDAQMAERVIAALTDIARESGDGRVLVVTSGGPIRAAEAHLRGIEQRTARRDLKTLANCGLIEFVVRDDVFTEELPPVPAIHDPS